MPSFAEYRSGYLMNWANLRIRPERAAEAAREAKRLLAGKERYQAVERLTSVPWWFVGLCHYRESHFNFSTYLGNGQPIDRRTTIVPIGRGPFLSFEDGAQDALHLEGFSGRQDWDIARVCYRLEGFNGYGYHARGVNSPYLYGGSTVYGPPEAKGGKFPRDHVFDPNMVDTQLGTLVVLKKLMELDKTIKIGAPVTIPPPDIPKPEPKPSAPKSPPTIPPKHIGIGGVIVAAGTAIAAYFHQHPVGIALVALLIAGAVGVVIFTRARK